MSRSSWKYLNICFMSLILLSIPIHINRATFDEWLCSYKYSYKYQKDPIKFFISNVSKTYDIDEAQARQIIAFAKKNSYKDFPTLKDILAIIGIESGFNLDASNKGAYGLMQIQYFWFKRYLTKVEDLYDPYINLSLGIMTLRKYFLTLHSREDAIIAYQAGIGKFLEGDYTQEYLERYKEELTRYD